MADVSAMERMLELLIPAASAGVVSMALLQTLKSVVPVKRWYHEQFLKRRLFANPALGQAWLSASVGASEDATRFEYFYAQDAEVLFEKLQTSADHALDFATSPAFEPLFEGLCVQLQIPTTARDQWVSYLDGKREDTAQSLIDNAERLRKAQSAKLLIQTLVRQYLAGLHLKLDSLWTKFNQLLAILLSAALLYNLAPLETLLGASHGAGIVVIYCFFGGVIAPFAKDLLAAFVDSRFERPGKVG